MLLTCKKPSAPPHARHSQCPASPRIVGAVWVADRLTRGVQQAIPAQPQRQRRLAQVRAAVQGLFPFRACSRTQTVTSPPFLPSTVI